MEWRAVESLSITFTESTLKRGILMARLKGDAIFMFYLQRVNLFQQAQTRSGRPDDGRRKQVCVSASFTDLTGAKLVDQQGASLRVFPAVEAVQLCGNLVQLLISVVELGQELSVRPLHRNTNRGTHTKKIIKRKHRCLGQKMQYAEERQRFNLGIELFVQCSWYQFHSQTPESRLTCPTFCSERLNEPFLYDACRETM